MTLSAKRKIKLYCLSIKQIKIFKTKTQQQKIIELVFQITKMVGKIYYQESRGAPFKAYVKKQVTYWLKCKKRTDNKSIIAKPVVIK